MASAKSPTPLEPRRAAKARATREQLVAVARRLFEARGYDSITVRDIAVAAGLSTGAIFSGFSDKGDLFKAAFPTDHQQRRVAEAMCNAYYAASVWAAGSSALRDRWLAAAADALARPSIATRAA
jgi:DNA-binding transcriptional regulator YbjK